MVATSIRVELEMVVAGRKDGAPLHVFPRSGRTGLDRLLATYDRLSGSPGERMKRLIKAREALFFASGRPR